MTRSPEKVLASIRAGASISDASRHVGYSPRTIEKWLAAGRRDPDSKHGPFARQVEQIRAARQVSDREPLDEAELLTIASEAARKGSIPAMRLVYEILSAAEAEPVQADPLAAVDEIARRRAANGST